jgi:hypothetical protein
MEKMQEVLDAFSLYVNQSTLAQGATFQAVVQDIKVV